MKEQQVKIVITGTHKRPGISHIEDTKSEAVGMYRSENGTHIIEYEEYLEDVPAAAAKKPSAQNTVSVADPGASGTGAQTTGAAPGGSIATYNLVQITPSSMTVTRQGSVESVLRFEQGKEHVSEYKTPFGAMKSRVFTTRYATYSLEKGNRLIAEAEYTVSMNGMEMSETTMRIDAPFL